MPTEKHEPSMQDCRGQCESVWKQPAIRAGSSACWAQVDPVLQRVANFHRPVNSLSAPTYLKWCIRLQIIPSVKTAYLASNQPLTPTSRKFPRTAVIIFMEITHLRHIPFLGETVSVAEGVRNPWMLVGQLGLVLLVIFVADAGVTAWRRGNRRTALTVGGSVVFFTIVATGQSLLVFWGIVQAPITASLCFFGVVAVMGYELSYDALRASQLDRELKVSQAGLRESEERMNLAVEGAHFGIWIRDLVRNEIWATDNWRALF